MNISNKQFLKNLRNAFRNSVFKRDKNKCVICGVKENLDAHHITDRHEMPNDGYVISNGISLCEIHHIEAEEFHMTGGQDWIKNMHPSDLYKLIGSSHQRAIDDSNKLE
jgi:hypothetical protein